MQQIIQKDVNIFFRFRLYLLPRPFLIKSDAKKMYQLIFLSDLEAQMLLKYHISEDDFIVLEEVVQLQQPYKAGKPWKFAGSFYYATTVLTTIGMY